VALIKREIASIVEGVSQQTPSKRSDGQVTEAINIEFSPVTGATSRPSSEALVSGPSAAPADRYGGPLSVNAASEPTLIHEIDRGPNEKYNVYIIQHDVSGNPLVSPEIKVLDAVTGSEYTVHYDTGSREYLATLLSDVTHTNLSAVTLFDVTYIANKEKTVSMEPHDVEVMPQVLITVKDLPTELQTQASNALVSPAATVTAYTTKEQPELDSDGTNRNEYDLFDETNTIFSFAADPTILAGINSDLASLNSINLASLTSEYADALLETAQRSDIAWEGEAYKNTNQWGGFYPIPLPETNTTALGSNGNPTGITSLNTAQEYPEAVATFSGTLNGMTPSVWESYCQTQTNADLYTYPNNALGAGVPDPTLAKPVMGVWAFLQPLDILFLTPPTSLEPKYLKFNAVFVDPSGVEPDDVRPFYVQFNHQDKVTTTYTHFRSNTEELGGAGLFDPQSGNQYRPARGYPPTAPNEILNIFTLKVTHHNAGSSAMNNPYQEWRIEPDLSDVSWTDDMPDLVVNELTQDFPTGYAPYVYLFAVLGMKWTRVNPYYSGFKIWVRDSNNYAAQNTPPGTSNSFPAGIQGGAPTATSWLTEPWVWMKHEDDQIVGHYQHNWYDVYNRQQPEPFDKMVHPRSNVLEELRGLSCSVTNVPFDSISVISGESGPSSIADLPYHAPNGFVTKIQGDTESYGDEYYLKYSDKGRVWVESRTKWESHTLDSDTMPHILRKVLNGNTVEFVFQAASDTKDPALPINPPASQWKERLVGDDANSPPPSFVGSTVGDMFVYRDRLALVSGSYVVLSETAEPMNFFATSLQTFIESDPMDLQVTQTGGSVVDIFAALPLENGVMLFDKEQQFLLSADQGQSFTGKTASINYVSSYPVSEKIRPIFLGDRVLWLSTLGQTTRVWEYQPSSRTVKFDEITSHVPTYIPAGASQLIGSENESIVVVRSRGEEGSLFIYKFFYTADGRKLQQAWSKWTLGGDIKHSRVINGSIYLSVHRNNDLFMEKITPEALPDFPVNSGDYGTVRSCLNHKLEFSSDLAQMQTSGGGATTTLFVDSSTDVKFEQSITPDFIAMVGPGHPQEGLIIADAGSPITTGSGWINIPGDWNTPGTVIIVGQRCSHSVTLSPFYLRSNNRRLVEQENREQGRTQIKALHVSANSTVALTARTTFDSGPSFIGGVSSNQTFNQLVANQLTTPPNLRPAVIPFDINGGNLSTTINLAGGYLLNDGTFVDSPFGMAITGLTYEVQHYSRGRRASR